jgi:hypothetical protein
VAHGKPPQFAILNHAAVDSGIPRESATQRIGIMGGADAHGVAACELGNRCSIREIWDAIGRPR